jgi:hypothetical protein
VLLLQETPALDVPLPPRTRRLPARYRDIEPDDSRHSKPDPPEDIPPLTEVPMPPSPIQHIFTTAYKTVTNAFNIFRAYAEKPLLHVTKAAANSNSSHKAATSLVSKLFPFPNRSAFMLYRWHLQGATKSLGDLQNLVDVLAHPEFNLDEIKGAKFSIIGKNVDDAVNSDSHPLCRGMGWKTADILVKVPLPKQKPMDYTVPGLRYRSIWKVVADAVQKSRPDTSPLHYVPFCQFWRCPTPKLPDHIERVYNELYTSDAWLKEHAKLQSVPPEISADGTPCNLPKAIAGLMFWSDATQLANFGSAKLWPLYLFLGNQSRYFRSRLTSGECHQIAYFPSVSQRLHFICFLCPTSPCPQLPDNIQDEILKVFEGKRMPTKQVLTHTRRELIHAVWEFLLDDEFIEAYHHGIPMMCGDGVMRRIYPRIFTYSADYPEKYVAPGLIHNGANM